ncbi:hypothetical protein [Mycobacterium sp. ACS4331]|uniref:hypothetical protein n=1 Tax=Mycobacterium sp. ACS4331 TaxID=1834121 RepID=UPI0012F82467|nr:hypothetical protein [Mycobacterium sp. ACS4331]
MFKDAGHLVIPRACSHGSSSLRHDVVPVTAGWRNRSMPAKRRFVDTYLLRALLTTTP